MNPVKIEALIQQLVADINTRALSKSRNGEAWTVADCKRGADFGRAAVKILIEGKE